MEFNKNFIGEECPNCKCISYYSWNYEDYTKLLCKGCCIVSKIFKKKPKVFTLKGKR